MTYVANTIRARDREIPYSVVSAIELQVETGDTSLPPIWLNQWAADNLGAKAGDEVTLEYFLWSDQDGLETASARFMCVGVLPMNGIGGDQTLTPDYPGISDAADITAWDPPFPVDLQRITKKDEDYWDQYRAAPKAIITVRDAQRLWGSRYGKVSSLRLSGDLQIGAQALDPGAAGFTARLVREEAAAAAQGTTDFGQYFLYFSFFLVVAALLLAYLFLPSDSSNARPRWACSHRSASRLRRFAASSSARARSSPRLAPCPALRRRRLQLADPVWPAHRWVGAVGTRELTLHVSPQALATGVVGTLIFGLAALWLGVRAMSRRSARALLKGEAAVRSVRFDAGHQGDRRDICWSPA